MIEKNVDKISLKHWAIYLTHTTVRSKNSGDTWINLVSPKEMEDFYERTRCGAGKSVPDQVEGKSVLDGVFNETKLIKNFNPLELMLLFYIIVPARMGSSGCVPIDYDDMKYIFKRDYNLFYKFHNERITMRLDYNSEHLNGGVLGLKKNIVELIRYSDLSRL